MNWFECKVIYEKPVENTAAVKKVPELYLVDALSFTEAEARIIEEMTPFITGSFEVSDIKRAKYNELFFCDEETADRWFKSKVYFVILDEKSGKEKKTANNFLVQAANLKDAVKKLEDGLKNTMMDYYIASMAETAIMDVYPYKVKNEKPEFQAAGEQK
jgi:chlorite dismutase